MQFYGSSTTIYICQKSSKCTLKNGWMLLIMKLYLNKAYKKHIHRARNTCFMFPPSWLSAHSNLPSLSYWDSSRFMSCLQLQSPAALSGCHISCFGSLPSSRCFLCWLSSSPCLLGCSHLLLHFGFLSKLLCLPLRGWSSLRCFCFQSSALLKMLGMTDLIPAWPHSPLPNITTQTNPVLASKAS